MQQEAGRAQSEQPASGLNQPACKSANSQQPNSSNRQAAARQQPAKQHALNKQPQFAVSHTRIKVEGILSQSLRSAQG